MTSLPTDTQPSRRRSLVAAALALVLSGFMVTACANSHGPSNANEDTPASAYSGERD